MIKELEKVAEIFLTNVDADDYEENRRQLIEWEQSIEGNRLLLSWQNHAITKEIMTKAKDSYLDFAVQLAEKRELTEDERKSLQHKQDACKFILSLGDKDALGEIQQILTSVKTAIARAM